jgi:hypothetical protein
MKYPGSQDHQTGSLVSPLRTGYVLTKQEFWDAVNLRYNWPLTRMPSNFVCGAKFDLTHAFTCKQGGFVSNRHDSIRTITTNLLNEVCKDVCVEPAFTALSGESIVPKSANTSSEARLDISATGVWTTACFGDSAMGKNNDKSLSNNDFVY